MKKNLLYIGAIPIGLVASMVLPKIFEIVLNLFIPFDVINNFIDNYIMKILSGWIAVGMTMFIAPSRKKIFGIIMLLMNVAAIVYTYSKGAQFNYLFIIGGILAFIFVTVVISGEEKESFEH